MFGYYSPMGYTAMHYQEHRTFGRERGEIEAMQLESGHDMLTEAFEGRKWRSATFVTDPEREVWWSSDKKTFELFVNSESGRDSHLGQGNFPRFPTPDQVRWIVAASRMKEEERRKEKFDWGVSAFAMSPNERVCAMAHGGRIFVADTATGAVKHVIQNFDIQELCYKLYIETSSASIFAMQFTPDGTKLVVGRSSDMWSTHCADFSGIGVVMPVFDMQTGKQCGRVEEMLRTRRSRSPLTLTIDPTGRVCAMTIDGFGDVKFEVL